MIVEKEVFYKVNAKTLDYYRGKGYSCDKGDIISIKIEDLKDLSSATIHYVCDKCGEMFEMQFKHFTARHPIYDKTYCTKCANEIRVYRENKSKEKFLAKDGFKKCVECERDFPANSDYYFKDVNTKDNFSRRCKECLGKNFTDYLTKIPKDGYIYCKKCGRELPHTYQYFPADKSCRSGLRNVCRECDSKYRNFLSEDYIADERWTDEELALLKSIYSDYTNEEIIEMFLPQRTIRAISSMAYLMGLDGKSEDALNRSRAAGAAKSSEAQKGKFVSDETRLKISKAVKKHYSIYGSWHKGRKKSPEQCRMISERNRLSGRWAGNNNPRFKNPLSGSDNPNWLGGVTDMYRELRSDTKDWFNQSAEYSNYKCVITGLPFNNVHHTTSFKDIVEESLKIANLERKGQVSDYTTEEFESLTKVLQSLHNKYGLGACVSSEIHKLFHDNYGYKDFSAHDFIDFIDRISAGEFDNWFASNNIPIKINIKYLEYLQSTLSNLATGA